MIIIDLMIIFMNHFSVKLNEMQITKLSSKQNPIQFESTVSIILHTQHQMVFNANKNIMCTGNENTLKLLMTTNLYRVWIIERD